MHKCINTLQNETLFGKLKKTHPSSQDDELPALTGSNRLFQRTTVYTPNSGKSERSTRQYPPTDQPTAQPRAKTPIFRVRAKRNQIKFQTTATTSQWQWPDRPDQWHFHISPTFRSALLTRTRMRTNIVTRATRVAVRDSARACAHLNRAPHYDSNLNSTGGTDELVTSSSSNHVDSGASSLNTSGNLILWQSLFINVAVMIIVAKLIAT